MTLKQHGLPLNEGLVLSWIYLNPGCRQSSWSHVFAMGPTVSSPVVRRLVSKKLVREHHERDKTGSRLVFKTYTVTADGRRIAEKLNLSRFMLDVKAFHEKFGLAYDGPPRALPEELSDLSVRCLKEEVREYEEAVKAGDLEAQFDALIDLVYFAFGRAYLHGFPFDRGWPRIQDANMSKVRASKSNQGKRGSSLDVVKPKGWQPPTLTDLVQP